MTIKTSCEKWTHQFEWHSELGGVSHWVCSRCGEWREMYEDMQGG